MHIAYFLSYLLHYFFGEALKGLGLLPLMYSPTGETMSFFHGLCTCFFGVVGDFRSDVGDNKCKVSCGFSSKDSGDNVISFDLHFSVETFTNTLVSVK